MRDRLIFGPILIAIVICFAWLDDFIDRSQTPSWWPRALSEAGTFPPAIIVLPVIFLLSLLASGELASLFRKKGINAGNFAITAGAILGLACWVMPNLPYAVVSATALTPTIAVIVLGCAMISFLRGLSPVGVLTAVGAALLSFVYLGLLPGFLFAIRVEFGVWILLWTVLVVKSCDIGALFAGKTIGRHKLIPWLSPGKTWEGLIGGAAFASLIAVLGLYALAALNQPIPWSIPTTAFAGAAAGVLGQLGDLVKSSFKRDSSVKDSGSVIPGMGGIIDLIDSPIFVGPFAYWALLLA